MGYLTRALKAAQSSRNKSRGEIPKAKDDLPEMLWKQALEDINSQYFSGTIPYIRENNPALWQKMVDSENRLSNSWLTGETEGFKRALKEWCDLNLKGIEIFATEELLHGNYSRGGEDKSA